MTPRAPKTQRARDRAIGPERIPASWILPLAVAMLAVLVRLPNLGWGLPVVEEEALPMKRAFAMWGWGTGTLQLDPGTAGWPSLSFYLHLLLQHLHYAAGRLSGAFADRLDYFVAVWLDPGPQLRLARSLGVCAAAVVAAVGTRLATSLTGAAGGMVAGGLLALSPLLVAHAQLVEPDILVALFSALALERLVAVQRGGGRRDSMWAGLWIGLGMSSKYTPLLMLPAAWLAHRLAGDRTRGLGGFGWTTALAFGVFAATSPWLFADPATALRDFRAQATHMTAGHFGGGHLPGPLFYLVGVLGPGLGWTGWILALAGLTWAAWRRRGPWLVIAAAVAPFVLGLGLLRTQFPRYMLPALLPLAVGLAAWVPELRARAGRARGAAIAGLALIALVPAALGVVRYHQERARPATGGLAARFLDQAAAGGQPRIAAEVLSLTLPTAAALETLDPRIVAALGPARSARLASHAVHEVAYLPMYTVQPEGSAYYYDLRHYLAHDYVVTSEAVRGRYRREPERFARQVAFYADLERFGTEVLRATPGDRARGPEIRVYGIHPDSARALERQRGLLDPEPPPARGSGPRATTSFCGAPESAAA